MDSDRDAVGPDGAMSVGSFSYLRSDDRWVWSDAVAAMHGFHWTVQRDLLEPYVDQFFARVAGVFEAREKEFARAYFGGLFPAYRVERDTLERSERLYREDLGRWPENGWSLWGLSQCLQSRGAQAEAAEVEARFHKAWARADTRIASTCLCVAPGQ